MIPSLRIGLRGFWKRQTVTIITKTVINHKVIETPVEKTLRFMASPMPAEQVNRKPEEQRSWAWVSVYCECSIKLEHDSKVIVKDKIYKIGKLSDWTDAHFLVYEAVQDFVKETAST